MRSFLDSMRSHAYVAVEIDLPLSEAELADTLGLTVESVSSQFASLEERGHIKLLNNRKIMVPDFDALAKIAGQ